MFDQDEMILRKRHRSRPARRRRSASAFTDPETAVLEAEFTHGGFRIRYRRVDQATVEAVRRYQGHLRDQYPEWRSALEFQGDDLLLTVYPAQEAPRFLVRRLLNPAW